MGTNEKGRSLDGGRWRLMWFLRCLAYLLSFSPRHWGVGPQVQAWQVRGFRGPGLCPQSLECRRRCPLGVVTCLPQGGPGFSPATGFREPLCCCPEAAAGHSGGRCARVGICAFSGSSEGRALAAPLGGNGRVGVSQASSPESDFCLQDVWMVFLLDCSGCLKSAGTLVPQVLSGLLGPYREPNWRAQNVGVCFPV